MRSVRPTVSVLMAVHNGEKFLEPAIRSILRQTYKDFEFVVINDGSFDKTWEILGRFSKVDERIRVFEIGENRGLTKSLNYGLHKCRGEFIARFDCDDIAREDRLEKQVRAFRTTDSLVLVGSNVNYIDSETRQIGGSHLPLDDLGLRNLLFILNPFVHSSVMFPRELERVEKVTYDPSLELAQDYELWTRFADHGRLRNLGKRLVDLRIHADSVGEQKKPVRMRNGATIQEKYVFKLYGGGKDAQEARGRHKEFLSQASKATIERPLAAVAGCIYALDSLDRLSKRQGTDKTGTAFAHTSTRCIFCCVKNLWRADGRRLARMLIRYLPKATVRALLRSR